MQTLQKIQNSENLENQSKIESEKNRNFRIQKNPKNLRKQNPEILENHRKNRIQKKKNKIQNPENSGKKSRKIIKGKTQNPHFFEN